MSRIRQKSKNESCSIMSLEYFWKLSAQLGKYNFSYGRDSTNDSVSDSLSCDNYFLEIERDFDKMLNMKVVEGWLIYLLLKFHMIWLKDLRVMHARSQKIRLSYFCRNWNCNWNCDFNCSENLSKLWDDSEEVLNMKNVPLCV